MSILGDCWGADSKPLSQDNCNLIRKYLFDPSLENWIEIHNVFVFDKIYGAEISICDAVKVFCPECDMRKPVITPAGKVIRQWENAPDPVAVMRALKQANKKKS